jgi:hypothetical protein
MSQTPILTARQLFRSHVVSCRKCVGYYGGKGENNKKKIAKRSLCVVGSILFARAKAENPEANPSKPQNFPFVARLYERVLAKIGNEWIEARVIDKSTSARHQYEKLNEDTGLMKWRTAAETTVGYEVENRKGKFYVNSSNVKKLVYGLVPMQATKVIVNPNRIVIKHGG